jgi:hypothetical protein
LVTILLSLLYYLPSLLVALADSPWAAVVFLPVIALSLAFWSRLFVILPAMAIERNRGLEWAWLLTMRHGRAIVGGWILLFLIGVLAVLVLVGAYSALDLPAASLGQPGWPGAIFRLSSAFFTVLFTGAAAVYMASVFRQLTIAKGGKWPPSPNAAG